MGFAVVDHASMSTRFLGRRPLRGEQQQSGGTAVAFGTGTLGEEGPDCPDFGSYRGRQAQEDCKLPEVPTEWDMMSREVAIQNGVSGAALPLPRCHSPTRIRKLTSGRAGQEPKPRLACSWHSRLWIDVAGTGDGLNAYKFRF